MSPNSEVSPHSAPGTIRSGSVKQRFSFSKKQVLVFALVFGLFGTILIFRSFAATTKVATIQAETLVYEHPISPDVAIGSDPNADSGKVLNMKWGGTASKSVSLPNASKVGVRVRGTQCKGAPKMIFKIDGQIIISTDVSSTTFKEYAANASVKAGTHTVSITFPNDYSRSSCDRNLYPDAIYFYDDINQPDLALGKTTTSSGNENTSLTPDKAVDGLDSTRWSSAQYKTTPQWWRVDLGATYSVNRVDVNWEAAYSPKYYIQTSIDGVSYTTVDTVLLSAPTQRSSSFPATNARYIRIMEDLSLPKPYANISFWSVNVYGSAIAPVTSSPTDRDNDGILDASDQCPDLAGVASNFGCPPAVPPPTTTSSTLPKLSQSPPALVSPTTITLPTTRNQDVNLDPAKDYILKSTGALPGGLRVNGGRNVIWRGGHVKIDYVGEPVDYGSNDKLWQRARFGPQFSGFTGTVFIEGYLQDGLDGTEGIDALSSAPGSRFIMQAFNVGPLTSRAIIKWVNGLPTINPDFGGEPYAPLHRLASGIFWDNHPDAWQSWQTPTQTVLDLGTVSTSAQFDYLEGWRTGSSVRFNRINVRPFVFNNRSWIYQAFGVSGAGDFGVSDVWVEPIASRGNAVQDYVQVYNGGPTAWISNVKLGVPSGGDFAKPDLLGEKYVSPGYQ
jgi:hypothetical protein